MRSIPFLIVLTLALAALPLPGANAQEEAAAASDAPLLEDAAGDVTLRVGAGGQTHAQPMGANEETDSVDLLSLTLSETADAVEFTLHTTGQDTRFPPQYLVDFTFKRTDYTVIFETYATLADESDAYSYACLATLNEDDWYDYVACDEATRDTGAGTLSASFLKAVILDPKQQMPIKGDVFEDIRVTARTVLMFGMDETPNELVDLMPDDAAAAASFTITKGEEAAGDLVMASPERVRVSNGGATTFVFEGRVRNLGTVEHEVRLEAVDLPEGWSARLQSPLRVPPGEDRAFTVLASVPFAHEHGGFDQFNVSAVSARDAGSYAKIGFGVLHTPIPQPAGHHPALYLHAQSFEFNPLPIFGTYTHGYLNTDAEHATDVAELPWNSRYTELMSSTAMWYVGLNPSLAMGLDFDLERLGSIDGNVFGRSPGTGTMRASLEMWSPDSDEVVLAESDSATLSLTLDQATPFSLTLTPTPESDYVPYVKDQYLVLIVELERETPDAGFAFSQRAPTEPTLSVHDFKMVLPLDEYHDRLTGSAETASPLQLVADGPVERAGRPGTTLTYRFTVEGAAGTFDLSVAGGDAPLGELSTTSVTLESGESREVTLAVHIPNDAQGAESFEVLVFAHDRVDPSISAVARTITAVAQGEKAEADESEAFAAVKELENETPGPGLALVLTGVAMAGAALRRARRD